MRARYTEEYILHLDVDDGARLWVNEQLLIDWRLVPDPDDTGIATTAAEREELQARRNIGNGLVAAGTRWGQVFWAKVVVLGGRKLGADGPARAMILRVMSCAPHLREVDRECCCAYQWTFEYLGL